MNDDREFEQLESQLRSALARKDAPDGFEERVRALAAADPEPERLSWWSRVVTPHRARWATAMAALVLTVGGATMWERERARDRAEGEAAKARLQQALQITSQKLRQIQDRVQNVRDN